MLKEAEISSCYGFASFVKGVYIGTTIDAGWFRDGALWSL
jgi:hypothetical protein